MRVYALNPIITENPNTALSSSCLAGATSLSVYNNYGFSSTTNIFLIGKYTNQRAEIVKSSATTSDSITLSTATLYAHSQDENITLMLYDQVEFSRSDDGGLTYTVVATINLQVDRLSTLYIDNNGTSSSLWRYRLVNSLLSIYSDYSYSVGNSGYASYQLESLQNRIISLAQDYNMQILTFSDIAEWTNEATGIMAQEVIAADRMGLSRYVNNTCTNGVINLPDTFDSMKRLSVSTDGITFYKANPLPLDMSYWEGNESSAQNQFSIYNPVYYRQDNQIITYPTTITNYHMWYYRQRTALVNPQDSLDMVFRPWDFMIMNYNMFRFKSKNKQFKQEALGYYEMFNSQLQRFIERQSRWQFDQPDFVDENDFDSLIPSVRPTGKL